MKARPTRERESEMREGGAKKQKREWRSASEEAKEREQGAKNIPTCVRKIVGSAANANNQTDRNHKREREDKENNTKLSHTENTRHEKTKRKQIQQPRTQPMADLCATPDCPPSPQLKKLCCKDLDPTLILAYN